MTLYTRRPSPPVEAVQWRGNNAHEIEALIEGWGKVRGTYIGEPSALHVVGPMGWGWFLSLGDWLVRTSSTVDRVAKDEFEATYEPVEDSPTNPDPKFPQFGIQQTTDAGHAAVDVVLASNDKGCIGNNAWARRAAYAVLEHLGVKPAGGDTKGVGV